MYQPVNPPKWEEPCGIEGCARVTIPYPENEPCGLVKLGSRAPTHELPECSVTRSLDKWEANGLFNTTEDDDGRS